MHTVHILHLENQMAYCLTVISQVKIICTYIYNNYVYARMYQPSTQTTFILPFAATATPSDDTHWPVESHVNVNELLHINGRLN